MEGTGTQRQWLPVFGIGVLLLGPVGAGGAPGAPAKPGSKPSSARPAIKPVLPAPTGVTSANLPAVLKSLGYVSKLHAPYQRLMIEEEKYGYPIDVGFSKSGEWVVVAASLAPIPDLTRVSSAGLLNLLALNDTLLGVAFSYNRSTGQIVLNATRPAGGLTAKDLQRTIESLKTQVRKTDGLWDLSQQ